VQIAAARNAQRLGSHYPGKMLTSSSASRPRIQQTAKADALEFTMRDKANRLIEPHKAGGLMAGAANGRER